MTTRPAVRADNGVVASGHPLATEVGLSVLREGGTAVDAAVSAAAVLAVVKPMATSIGGDLFALVYDAGSGSVTAYNGSGASPRTLDPGRFADGYPDTGAPLATVPGVVAALGALLGDHGKFDLDRALRPAIDYAEHGFPVSDLLSVDIAANLGRLERDSECARIFTRNGRAPAPGTMLRQPDLAASLAEIGRRGAGAFYRGLFAVKLAKGIERIGGWISEEDLAAHETDRGPSLSIEYRGLAVHGQPPPSQGHVFIEELAIAEALGVHARSWRSPELVQLLVAAKRAAFADRDRFAGDPRLIDFDPRRLIDPEFVARRLHAIEEPASPDRGARVATDTTYLAVVDRDRNAVSLIESVFSQFGAAVIVPGTGVLLNNRMTGFSLDQRSPNAIAPDKRPVHTLNTVLALDGRRPRFVFGTPGSHAQVQTNLQLAVGLIAFGLDVQGAIEEPRWYDDGETLHLEARWPEATRRALAERGYRIGLLPDWSDVTGGAQAIAIEPSGTLCGGADPRREGTAAGY